jgi:hypothetical protein
VVRIAAFVITVTLGLPALTGNAGHALPWRELDLDGSPARCREMANALCSNDPAVWREAQIRLAHAGPAALNALESRALLSDPEMRSRVRDVVNLALGRYVTPRELAGHPRVMALVADSVAKGLALAPSLAGLGQYPESDAGPWFAQPRAPRSARPEEQMFALGGCAVPAALALLREPRPVGRAFGIGILARLGAVAMTDSVLPLVNDATMFSVNHGDYSSSETIGQRAKTFVASIDEVPSNRLYLYESGLQSDLIDGIRETSRSMSAKSWDDWWAEARPAWEDWWRLAGAGDQPPDREAWWNAVFEYQGFRLFRVPNPESGTVLHVTGPAGTRCRVETDSVVVAEGEVPLVVRRGDDSVSVQRRETSRDDPDGTYQVTATLPNGRRFQEGFFWSENTIQTVELLPALKARNHQASQVVRVQPSTK